MRSYVRGYVEKASHLGEKGTEERSLTKLTAKNLQTNHNSIQKKKKKKKTSYSISKQLHMILHLF